MKTIIYYFSGTGNSLFAANKLHAMLESSEVRPVISALKSNSFTIEAEAIGFIFPIYMMSIPLPVYELIQKSNLDNVNYIFAVATRLGTTHSAFTTIEKLLKKKNKSFNAYFNLTMGDNSARFHYTCPTEEEIMRLEKQAELDLKQIADIVDKRKDSKEKDRSASKKFPKIIMNLIANTAIRFNPKFHANENCISCGTCAQVCLSEKIKLIDGTPVWDKNVMCYKCNACVTFCPSQAAQVTGFTEDNPRYSHPYASKEDISKQKTV